VVRLTGKPFNINISSPLSKLALFLGTLHSTPSAAPLPPPLDDYYFDSKSTPFRRLLRC
jgi:hypothetical protein